MAGSKDRLMNTLTRTCRLNCSCTQNRNDDYNIVNDFDEHSLSLAEPTLLIANEEQTLSDQNTMKQKGDLDKNQISIQPLT